MKNKVTVMIIIVALIIIILLIFGISIESGENFSINEENQEIEPAEEMPDEINFDTKMNFYYEDKTSGVLVKEERLINAKDLVDNPYLYTIKELLNGPQSEQLINPIPSETKVNSVVLKNGTLTIDLSKEFLEVKGPNGVYAIVNTASEFNEVENVKITIDGLEKSEFKEKFVKIQ